MKSFYVRLEATHSTTLHDNGYLLEIRVLRWYCVDCSQKYFWFSIVPIFERFLRNGNPFKKSIPGEDLYKVKWLVEMLTSTYYVTETNILFRKQCQKTL